MPMETIHLPVPDWDTRDKEAGLETQPSSGSGAPRAEITPFWITLERHDCSSGVAGLTLFKHASRLKIR